MFRVINEFYLQRRAARAVVAALAVPLRYRARGPPPAARRRRHLAGRRPHTLAGPGLGPATAIQSGPQTPRTASRVAARASGPGRRPVRKQAAARGQPAAVRDAAWGADTGRAPRASAGCVEDSRRVRGRPPQLRAPALTGFCVTYSDAGRLPRGLTAQAGASRARRAALAQRPV